MPSDPVTAACRPTRARLEFHVERYTNLATQASVVAGFSFESLVELEVPEGTHWLLSSCYFVFGSASMALSLYVLCVASFACVFGHRLALQGPHGSLERAVHIMIEHRTHIFATAAAALVCLVGAAVLMAWIKMGAAAAVVSAIFITFAGAVYQRMVYMFERFRIPEDELVTGATRVQNPQCAAGVADLSRLDPWTRGRAHSASAAAANAAAGPSGASGHHGGGAPSGAAAGGAGYSRLPDSPSSRSTSSGASQLSSCGWFGAARGGGGARVAAAAAGGGGGGGGGGVAREGRVHHEGHLFKKGEPSLFGSETRRRYFVLRDRHLYYFKSWEDFGSATSAERSLRAAVNADAPIDMRAYQPRSVAASEGGGGVTNRFDLVPVDDPLARKWELQATTADEARDWVDALEAAHQLDLDAPRPVGQATVIVTAE